MPDEFYVPEPEHVRPQSENNKQGRSDERFTESEEREIIAGIVAGQRSAYQSYSELLEKNVARELARANLPVSLYTEWYWQIDLHNLFHFLRLRMDPHAQYEIRVFAEAMATCAKAVAPLAYEAFEEHSLGAINFSRAETAALGALLSGGTPQLTGRALATFEEKVARLRTVESVSTV